MKYVFHPDDPLFLLRLGRKIVPLSRPNVFQRGNEITRLLSTYPIQGPGALTYDWTKNGGQVSVPALSRCPGLVTLQQYLEVLLFVLGVSHFS